MTHKLVKVSHENYHLFDDMIYWRLHEKERSLKEKEVRKVDLPENLNTPNFHVYAVAVEGRFVAWISLIFLPKIGLANRKGYVYVDELWVEESYRRLGYAKLLMTKADEYCQTIEASGIRLGVNINNPSAKRLYEGCGYEDTGQAFIMEKAFKGD